MPIEQIAPRLPFVTGESYVAWLKLPEYVRPYQITVKSQLAPASGVFVPMAILLDECCRVTRRFGERHFSKLASGLTAQHLEGRIAVSNQTREERYVLFFTDASAVGTPAHTLPECQFR